LIFANILDVIISILTIFPQMVREVLSYGPVGRGVKAGILEINPVDLRDFTLDKHRSVDDKPFGGGPGMVMRVDIIDRALSALKRSKVKGQKSKVILLSPQGRLFNQQIAEEYSLLDHLILISGRYEGVDARVREHLVDEELSIGNYVLSGGEIPAMAVADAVARLIPGVLGNEESLVSESFSIHQPSTINHQSSTYDFPHYTQPAEYKGWEVPEVLRSGNHAEIQKWREEKAKKKITSII
jgi:tRNA (guanine37-N1)-methyltransferase